MARINRSLRSTVLVEIPRSAPISSTVCPLSLRRAIVFERRVGQFMDQMIECVGKSSSIIRGWLLAKDVSKAAAGRRSASSRRLKRRLAQHPATAPLLTGLVAHHEDGLAHRERGQQPPEIVSSAQLGKLALARAVTEALEGTDRHVFLVKRAAAMTRKFCTSQPDQTLEITVPQALDIRSFPALTPCNHCVTDSPFDIVNAPIEQNETRILHH